MMPKSIARDPAIGQGEQIPVVQVGVEETVDHRLAEEGSNEDRGERRAIVPRRDQRFVVVELDPVEPFQREHAAGGSPPVDLRHMIAGLGDHILAQLGGGRALALQVELARGPLLEVGNDQARPQALGFSAVALDVGRRPLVGLDRLVELFLDPRPKHFDRDLLAFGRDRAVNLGDGRGADRHFVELGEQAFERRAE